MCCGEVDANDFKDDGANTLHADVDTRKCGFTGQPFYFAQVYGTSYIKSIYTQADIVNPDSRPDEMNPDKFRVYLRNAERYNVLHLSNAKANKYSVKWCGFGSTSRPAPSYAMCCGSSRTKKWTGGEATLNVNTAGCGWKLSQDAARIAAPPPMYFTSLKDTAGGTSARVRSASVYSPSPTGFISKLQALPGQTMSGSKANDYNIDVQWCGVKPMAGTTGGSAGYPCTAPRVIVGNGDQAVQTNNAKICCEKTGTSGWKAGGRAGTFLEKTIDISPCNMKKVHVTMVDVRGDEGSVDRTGGGSSFSVGTNAKQMTVNVWTKGKYKFYDAERYHWRVQYCLIGV